MFEFDAGKFIIIGIVALIVIGPKDLPRVLRQLGAAVGKMRRMASEFQSQFMEAVREADMADLKADVAKLADSAKIDVAFDPLADIKAELKGAIDKAAPSSAASVADAAAAEAEVSTSMLAFPHVSGMSGAADAPRDDGVDLPARTEPGPEPEPEPQPQPQPQPQPEKSVDAEMMALASALKAEIGSAPQADALQATPRAEPAPAADLLRRRSMRDNA